MSLSRYLVFPMALCAVFAAVPMQANGDAAKDPKEAKPQPAFTVVIRENDIFSRFEKDLAKYEMDPGPSGFGPLMVTAQEYLARFPSGKNAEAVERTFKEVNAKLTEAGRHTYDRLDYAAWAAKQRKIAETNRVPTVPPGAKLDARGFPIITQEMARAQSEDLRRKEEVEGEAQNTVNEEATASAGPSPHMAATEKGLMSNNGSPTVNSKRVSVKRKDTAATPSERPSPVLLVCIVSLCLGGVLATIWLVLRPRDSRTGVRS